jgi:hypothetical protein
VGIRMKRKSKEIENILYLPKIIGRTLGTVLIVVLALCLFNTKALAEDKVTWLKDTNYILTNYAKFQDGFLMVQSPEPSTGYDYDSIQYGFIDVTGKLVFPLKQNRYGGFYEGLSSICIDDKYGFINTKGEVVIPAIYDTRSFFKEGLASVGIDGKYGFIDQTGKVVIPLKYNGASSFENGYAAVTNENNKIGFINKTGKLLVQTEYTDYGGDNIQLFSEGLCPVYNYYSETRSIKYGFIDVTGKLVIDTIYHDYGMLINPYCFHNGVSKVYIDDENFEIKYIDKTGKIVPQPIGEEGVITREEEKYGIIDGKGKVIVPFDYDYIADFNDGIAAVLKYDEEWNSSWGAVDKTGKIIVPVIYDNISIFSEGVIFVEKDEKIGIISNFVNKIGFKTTKKTLAVNQTFSQIPLINGGDISDITVMYTSSNTKVATVDVNGKISAKKAGNATITAKLPSGLAATYKVTVKNAPTAITINPSKLTLKVKGTYTLKTSLSEGSYTSKYTFKSTDSKIVTVDSKGKVTALKKGTATITVTTHNGKKATCVITVK